MSERIILNREVSIYGMDTRVSPYFSEGLDTDNFVSELIL